MATRSVSPGGALLRTSRMFSLPAPIPPPANEKGATMHHSDTATLAFPTHQVIATLPSARKQGDWGLKRPLPLKSTTRTTHPMLRVKAIDTVEQITDYASAADHGITLRKFQELHMPLTARRPAGGDKLNSTSTMNLPQKSVFEDDLDVTDIPPEKRAEHMDRRWKFTGPWLAGMTPGEFRRWLAEEVRPRRAAFRDFLRKKIAGEMHAAAAAEALDKAREQPPPVDPSSVSDEALLDYLRKLRHDNKTIYDMVGQFLDLAPLKPPSAAQMGLPTDSSSKLEFQEVKNPYAESGPPATHPSAGISYLRSSMYVENHPIYGPQKQHSPVPARVLRPRQMMHGTPAKLGMGGFVVNTPLGDTYMNSRTTHIYDRIDPSVVGGRKVWVLPQRASVDPSGRVTITVTESSAEAMLVAQELLGDAAVLGVEKTDQQAGRRETASEIRRKYRAADAPMMSSAQDYGLKV